MSHGGRREKLARHLIACARKWPKDDAEERRRWAAQPEKVRVFWRFLAVRAIAFLQDDERREHEDEVRAEVGGLLDARFDQAGEKLPPRKPPAQS